MRPWRAEPAALAGLRLEHARPPNGRPGGIPGLDQRVALRRPGSSTTSWSPGSPPSTAKGTSATATAALFAVFNAATLPAILLFPSWSDRIVVAGRRAWWPPRSSCSGCSGCSCCRWPIPGAGCGRRAGGAGISGVPSPCRWCCRPTSRPWSHWCGGGYGPGHRLRGVGAGSGHCRCRAGRHRVVRCDVALLPAIAVVMIALAARAGAVAHAGRRLRTVAR